MHEKAFASLTSGLLARKGAARPAMRPQGFGQQGFAQPSFGQPGATIEDLGWNDMGGDAPEPVRVDVRLPVSLSGPTSMVAPVPEVVRQQDEIVREFAPETIVAMPKPVIEPRAAGRKAAFTLRLDADRHLRLRLACAVEHRSAQQIVTAALDALLASMPDIERLAGQVPAVAKD